TAGIPHGARQACDAQTGDRACESRVCDGVARVACAAFVDSANICRTHACAGGIEIFEARCDGKGQCSTAQSSEDKACAPYACGADSCRTTCETGADCAAGASCDVASHECLRLSSCRDTTHLVSPLGQASD